VPRHVPYQHPFKVVEIFFVTFRQSLPMFVCPVYPVSMMHGFLFLQEEGQVAGMKRKI
jgi:hypothetical protein